VFIGIPRGEELFVSLHPLFTTLHRQTLKKLNFRMRFKYGLKAQKLLTQGVWGKTYESSIKKRYKTAATEGEEW
jgi:hypothetical protein